MMRRIYFHSGKKKIFKKKAENIKETDRNYIPIQPPLPSPPPPMSCDFFEKDDPEKPPPSKKNKENSVWNNINIMISSDHSGVSLISSSRRKNRIYTFCI
jgi:hypothetical protein